LYSSTPLSPSSRLFRAPFISTSLFFFFTRPPPSSTLFPYTTLFRSLHFIFNQLPGCIINLNISLCKTFASMLTYFHIAFGCMMRSEEHTSELQSRFDLVCRLLLEKKKQKNLNMSRTVSNIAVDS